MATVTIPVEGSGGNPVRVMINGVEYVVPRGVDTTVSDAVAAELAKPDMALSGGGGYPEDPRILPLVTGEDAGKVLTVDEEGAWAAVAPSDGGSITIDDALSGSSTNPVQNKVIKAALDAKGTYSKPSGGIPESDLASGVMANKITAPSSPATGAFLVYNGSAWVAITLSTWQGGSY